MNYADALAYLDGHVIMERLMGVGRPEAPSLDRMERLMSAMGEPQHVAPVIHITGTNGKGSTAQIATRLLVARESALLRYVEHYRAEIKRQAVACLAGKLRLDPEDLRLPVLAELATTAFTLAARPWVYQGGRGGRKALLERHQDAVKAIPASLDLSAPATPARDSEN